MRSPAPDRDDPAVVNVNDNLDTFLAEPSCPDLPQLVVSRWSFIVGIVVRLSDHLKRDLLTSRLADRVATHEAWTERVRHPVPT